MACLKLTCRCDISTHAPRQVVSHPRLLAPATTCARRLPSASRLAGDRAITVSRASCLCLTSGGFWSMLDSHFQFNLLWDRIPGFVSSKQCRACVRCCAKDVKVVTRRGGLRAACGTRGGRWDLRRRCEFETCATLSQMQMYNARMAMIVSELPSCLKSPLCEFLVESGEICACGLATPPGGIRLPACRHRVAKHHSITATQTTCMTDTKRKDGRQNPSGRHDSRSAAEKGKKNSRRVGELTSSPRRLSESRLRQALLGFDHGPREYGACRSDA